MSEPAPFWSRVGEQFAEAAPLVAFVGAFAFAAFGYGVAVGKYRIFPYAELELAALGFGEVVERMGDTSDSVFAPRDAKSPPIINTADAYRGLNLVTRFKGPRELTAEIVAMDGRVVHAWKVDWFELWPHADHVSERARPRSRPGTHIHGAVIMPNGDLVFNFEHLGLIRLSRAGEVVWRLPYRTHHSVELHEGNLWVSGEKEYTTEAPRFPGHEPPFDEYTVLEVSPGGQILSEWSIPALLEENGYRALMFLGTLRNHSTATDGDRLHLNDVEPFPRSLSEGTFKHGDVLVSLRNINTLFVFNRTTRKIRFLYNGCFVRQHDPDFIDGDTVSVFDNNNVGASSNNRSRILTIDARDRTCRTFFEGSKEQPFYTDFMGKHQWLPNGNLLVTESRGGRAFELNTQGRLVWQYVNYIDRDRVGLVQEVQRVPLDVGRVLTAAGPPNP